MLDERFWRVIIVYHQGRLGKALVYLVLAGLVTLELELWAVVAGRSQVIDIVSVQLVVFIFFVYFADISVLWGAATHLMLMRRILRLRISPLAEFVIVAGCDAIRDLR